MRHKDWNVYKSANFEGFWEIHGGRRKARPIILPSANLLGKIYVDAGLSRAYYFKWTKSIQHFIAMECREVANKTEINFQWEWERARKRETKNEEQEERSKNKNTN